MFKEVSCVSYDNFITRCIPASVERHTEIGMFPLPFKSLIAPLNVLILNLSVSNLFSAKLAVCSHTFGTNAVYLTKSYSFKMTSYYFNSDAIASFPLLLSSFPQTSLEVCSLLGETNIGTLIVSIVTIVGLIIAREVNVRLAHKLPVHIPFHLLAVSTFT